MQEIITLKGIIPAKLLKIDVFVVNLKHLSLYLVIYIWSIIKRQILNYGTE